MTEPLSSELIARYLASEATADEREIVDSWAAVDPANRADLEHMQAVWTARPATRTWDVDHAWKKVEGRLDQVATMTPIRPLKRSAATIALRIAAVAVLAVGITFGWLKFGPGASRLTLVASTGVGMTQSGELPDGTRYTLGPASSLSMRNGGKGFAAADVRRVDLNGEAWFEVKHDAAHPFQVHALGTITEDLGTSFSVRAYPSDSVVHVVVAEGSASVRLAGAPVEQGATLKARDAVDLDARTFRAHIFRSVSVESLVAWRSGRIEFNDAPLSDVATELQRWYGITVLFEPPSIGTRRVSYTMPTKNRTEALNVFELLAARIEHKGDTLIVR